MMLASVVSPAALVVSTCQRAVAVDRAGEDVVAGRFRHRPAFAGDRRLVDVADAGDDAAVERNPFARLDDESSRRSALTRRDDFLAAVRLRSSTRAIGGARSSSAATARRARPTLHDSRASDSGEQESHGRRLQPFADRHRADHGDRHQQVHVGPQAASGIPRLGKEVPDARQDAQRRSRAQANKGTA